MTEPRPILPETRPERSPDTNENDTALGMLRDLFPAPSASEVQSLRDALAEGGEANPRLLFQVLMTGSVAERTALRTSCATPRARARNQDLNLPRLIAALNGKSDDRKRYEQSRIIIPETLPEWGQEVWLAESNAEWRTLDLHGSKFKKFYRRVGSEAERQFQSITILPYDPNGFMLDAGNICFPDERTPFLTFSAAKDYIHHFAESSGPLRMARTQLALCDHEIRLGIRILGSTTPIGEHYRAVALREIRFLFAAQLVEDCCVAFDLPLTREGKVRLMREILDSPLDLIKQKKLPRLSEPMAILRAEGKTEDEITQAVEAMLFKPGALADFHAARRPAPIQPTEPVSGMSTAEGEWPPPEVVASRKQGLVAALRRATFASRIDVDRQARLLLQFVKNSKLLFDRSIELINQNVMPDGIAAELKVRRSHSHFKVDERPAPAKQDATPEIAPPTDLDPKVAEVQAAANPSKRLLLMAAMESHTGLSRAEMQRLARVIDKLTNEAPAHFERALEQIAEGANVNQIVAELREGRAPVVSRETRAPTDVMSNDLMRMLDIGIRPRSEEISFSFSHEAELSLTDGRVRHAVDRALEHYAEKPELADLKRIHTEENIWELRLLRENLRVYLLRRPNNQIHVIFIGSKNTQSLDIERLPAIATRERERLERLM